MAFDISATHLPILAKCLLAGSGEIGGARRYAEAVGAPPRVLKATVGAITSADGGLADAAAMTSAFIVTLRTTGVFFRLFDSGFRRVPRRVHIGAVTASRPRGSQARVGRSQFRGSRWTGRRCRN